MNSSRDSKSSQTPTEPRHAFNKPARRLKLEPSGGDHDTVRSYGGQVDASLSQEALLLDLANRLDENRIEFIVLRSTNSLDQIFLSQFLRRAYPEGRVVIDGADLLFTRGAEGRSLRGVMLLSTYPLFGLAQDWTPPLFSQGERSYRTFGDDTSEGVYVAARDLFRNKEASIPLYVAPAWATGSNAEANNRPSTWLTVIGRRQMWPLAALNANTLPKLTSPAVSISGPVLPGTPGSRQLRIPVSMWLFLVACTAWSCVHLYFCWKGSIKGSPRARASLAHVFSGSTRLSSLWAACF